MNFSKCKKDFVVVLSFYISILLIVSAPKFINAQITTGSLLDEMIDRSSLTKYPIPSYSCGQFGSYDRNTDEVDGEGWFANWDRSYWLRIEYNKGRREFVMMDSQGPGAVVRFWVTVAAYGGNGTLRIYIDGAEEPIIEGEIFKLLSGGALVAEPLATSVSKASNYLQRGHNLYFPIPYAQHCKITYESAALTEEPGAKSGEALYYNINFRTYEEGTNVKSFTKNDLTELADKIQNANTILNNPNEEISNIDELAIDYALGVTNSVVSLGKYTLTKGEHQLKIVIKGANPSAIKKYMFGIDYIDVIPLTTGMNHINEANETKVFPNPFSNEIFISRLKGKDNAYGIFNIQGIQVIFGTLNGNNMKAIDTSGLPNGEYILSIDNQYSFKILKRI